VPESQAMALRSRRVPASARRATVEPGGVCCPAGSAAMGPAEALGKSECATVFVERLPDLAMTLEDRPEICVEPREVRSLHLELLELLGCFVQHGQLEVSACQPERDGEILGMARCGDLVERDYPGRAAISAVDLFDAREDGKARLRLERA